MWFTVSLSGTVGHTCHSVQAPSRSSLTYRLLLRWQCCHARGTEPRPWRGRDTTSPLSSSSSGPHHTSTVPSSSLSSSVIPDVDPPTAPQRKTRVVGGWCGARSGATRGRRGEPTRTVVVGPVCITSGSSRRRVSTGTSTTCLAST